MDNTHIAFSVGSKKVVDDLTHILKNNGHTMINSSRKLVMGIMRVVYRGLEIILYDYPPDVRL